MNAMSPGLGHNQPPDDPDDPEFLTRLQARLDPEDKQIFDRLAELEVGQGQIPDPLPSEAVAARAVSWVAQCRLAEAEIKKAHKKNKSPILALGRWIDARYLRRVEAFNRDVVNPIEARVRRFRQAKADAQRIAEEEARRKAAQQAEEAAAAAANRRREAQLAEDAGNRRGAVALTRQAEAAQAEADKQDALAHMPDQPVRIEGEHGATAYAVKRWTFYVADPETLPARFWMPDETAIKDEMNRQIAEGKDPTIPGVSFTLEEDTRIRRC